LVAAIEASASVALSHLEPLRVLPERNLPPDSLLPGQTPAQEARCLGVGNALMSTPISAISTSAVRCWTSGIVMSRSRWRGRGRFAPRSRLTAGDRLVQEVQVGEDLGDDQRVLGIEGLERLAECRDL
jgi:hypothetical protein